MPAQPHAMLAGLAVVSFCTTAHSGPTAAFGEIPGALAFDISIQGANTPIPPRVYTVGGAPVTVSFVTENVQSGLIENPAILGGYSTSFPSWEAPIDPAVAPGDYKGRFETREILTLNFDPPLTGAGVTLTSSYNVMQIGCDVTAYTGPDATGTTLGLVATPDNPSVCCPLGDGPNIFAHFAGFTDSTGLGIRSLVISPRDAVGEGFGLDTLALAPPAGPAGCNPADVAEPAGTLDIDDVLTFLAAFADGDTLADVAEPLGTLDIDDVLSFLNAFATGCP